MVLDQTGTFFLYQGFTLPNNPNNYTGLLETGADYAILRFSMAAKPDVKRGPGCTTPGISLKMFRNGQPSANAFGLYSLLGQDSFNFFKHDLSTQPPDFGDWAPPAFKVIKSLFSAASDYPTMLGISSLATFDKNGNPVNNPNFPFRLVFHPVTKYHTMFGDDYPGMIFYQQLLNSLVPGPAYDVYAQDQAMQGNDKIFKIGTIEMTSVPTTSHFGDRALFFQHTNMETDSNYMPNLLDGAKQVQQMQQNTPSPGYLYPDLPWE